MKKYFCASDIHSFYYEWRDALDKQGFDENDPNHIIIICGDLFDRGPNSLECYEFIKKLIAQNRVIYIRGNHEDLLYDCVGGLSGKKHFGSHHMSNGTVKTVAQLIRCSEYDIACGVYHKNRFEQVTSEVLQFIDKHSVDYFELGNTVFVHGWVPTTIDEENHMSVDVNWRDGDWSHARWECGFDCWRCGLYLEDKTIVCGHWHTSYAWAETRGLSEWGHDACFKPFIKEGIVMLDACTAYTKFVNVLVFDEQGNIIEGGK